MLLRIAIIVSIVDGGGGGGAPFFSVPPWGSPVSAYTEVEPTLTNARVSARNRLEKISFFFFMEVLLLRPL
jgi:hypothetical protein